MSYILITGIVFAAVPLVLIEGFAFFILMNFVRDDDDAAGIFRFALMSLGFGTALIIIHFVVRALT